MIQFNIEGMSCQHCVGVVTRAIQEIDPAAKVEIDLATGRVSVESGQSAEALKAAIEEADYTVKGIVPNA